MALDGALTTLLGHLPQASAVALMGFDGLPVRVCEHAPTGDGLPTALASYARALASLMAPSPDALPLGPAATLVVHGTGGTVVLKALMADHYLAVVQAPQAPVGRALCYMDLATPTLLAEL